MTAATILADQARVFSDFPTESAVVGGTTYGALVLDSVEGNDLQLGGFLDQTSHKLAFNRVVMTTLPSEGDRVTFRSASYRITRVERDDAGASIILDITERRASTDHLPLFYVGNNLLLQADNGFWYRVRLVTASGLTIIEVAQGPENVDDGYAPCVVLTGGDGYNHKVCLRAIDGPSTVAPVEIDVEQVSTIDTAYGSSLQLTSSDGFGYTITLVTQAGLQVLNINQTHV